MSLESSGKPDAWKLACPVWGWGRGVIPRPTPPGKPTPADFVATSIRCSRGRPLGNYRWLVWAVFPITQDNVENTAFQELQVIPQQ